MFDKRYNEKFNGLKVERLTFFLDSLKVEYDLFKYPNTSNIYAFKVYDINKDIDESIKVFVEFLKSGERDFLDFLNYKELLKDYKKVNIQCKVCINYDYIVYRFFEDIKRLDKTLSIKEISLNVDEEEENIVNISCLIPNRVNARIFYESFKNYLMLEGVI